MADPADDNAIVAVLVPTLIAFVLIVLWLVIPAAGGWIVYRGARARLIDDHERCRRCRYVLVEQPVRPTRCTECGAHLTAANIVRGARGPQWGMVTGGVAVILLGLAPAGLLRPPRAAPPVAAITALPPAPRPARPVWQPRCPGCGGPHTALACPDWRPPGVARATAPVVEIAPNDRPEPLRVDSFTPGVPIALDFDNAAPPDHGAEGPYVPSSAGADLSWLDDTATARWRGPSSMTWTDIGGGPTMSWNAGLPWAEAARSRKASAPLWPAAGPPMSPSPPALRSGGSAARNRAAPSRVRPR